MVFLGIDLAWGEGSAAKLANQSGVVALTSSGRVVDAGWTVGLDETVGWIAKAAEDDSMLFIDAPLIVNNEVGTARLCERQVSQRYMHPWKVGANSTNPASERLAGVRLLEILKSLGWLYADGASGPAKNGRSVSECYPYTTIVGTEELDYDERPLYKRKPKGMGVTKWRPIRARECDELIRRVSSLENANPALDLASHPVTAALLDEPSPEDDKAYKSREDLLDAALCAWTASIWARHGTDRCQVLGLATPRTGVPPLATIIAPARLEQRAGEEIS